MLQRSRALWKLEGMTPEELLARNKVITMSERRREMFFRVIDGVVIPRMLKYMHALDGYQRCDQILKWLIVNHKTGKNFLAFVDLGFKYSVFQMAKFILSEIDRDLQVRRSLHKREFRVK